MKPIHKGIAILLRSAITGEQLALPEGFSPEEAMPILKKQQLIPMAYLGAKNCGIPSNLPWMQTMLQVYLKNMLRSEQQMYAVSRIFRTFEENGIDYLPVKGCVLKSLYPAPELRPMGDADILIRVEQYDKIVPLMEALGFRLDHEIDYDYIWRSEHLVAELHKMLLPPGEKQMYELLGNGWDRAVKTQGCRYQLSCEDTFLHLFAHMTKHYQLSGIGCRQFVDLFVYQRSHPDLDTQYLRRQLGRMNLLKFYENVQDLLQVWFEDAPENPVTDHMTEYIFSGGSWGTLENAIRTQAMRHAAETGKPEGTRLSSFVNTVFPPARALHMKYPVLQKLPVLLPLVWIFRWLEVLVTRPARISRKMRVVADITDEKVAQRKQALEYVGLEYQSE